MKLVIVGGGAGGASVAARARRLDDSLNIVLIERSPHISQATCGYPYYIGDVIRDRARLTVVDSEEFRHIVRADVRTGSEVVAIDPAHKLITIHEVATGRRYIEAYDKLVLAPGSRAVRPELPGADAPHVHTVDSLVAVDAIKHQLDRSACENAVVVGGGFIGLEMVENLHRLGVSVSLVERSAQVMNELDAEMAAMVTQQLRLQRVEVRLNESVDRIEADRVWLGNGQALPADLVILAVGVRPQTSLAQVAGLELGPSGGIRINDCLQTSDPDIYALGDSIEMQECDPGIPAMVQLAGPAQQQATRIAAHVTGRKTHYRRVAPTSIAKVFDLAVASTGLSEQRLRQAGVEYRKVYVDIPDHAGFYPGAQSLAIKLLFAPETGVLLGAQVVGNQGVDKRIDVFATAIQSGLTVFDLAELELAYAPPWSSPRDPVNVAGMAARNLLEGCRVIYWDQLEARKADGALVIDVRTLEEYQVWHLEESINIPLEQLRDRLHSLPVNRELVLVCHQGKKGYFASRLLQQHGFDLASNLSGGLRLYRASRAEVCASDHAVGNDAPVQHETGHANVTDTAAETDNKVHLELDATGLSCPGPILKLSKGIKSINDGEYLLIRASDSSFYADVDSWCQRTGNILHQRESRDATITAVIQKHPGKTRH